MRRRSADNKNNWPGCSQCNDGNGCAGNVNLNGKVNYWSGGVRYICKIPIPSEYPIVSDSVHNQGTSDFFKLDVGNGRVYLAHMGKANFWFFDGHVRSVEPGEFGFSGALYPKIGTWGALYPEDIGW